MNFLKAIIVFLISTLSVPASYSAETMNLVTYYPVPFGAYDRVKLIQRASNLTSPCEIGTMYVDTGGQFQFCRNNSGVGVWTTITPNAGIWTQTAGDDIYPTDTATNPNLFVGLGTITPQNRLDVEGAAVIGAAYSGTNVGPANGLLVEGNVGLGNTSPSTALDIESTTATAGIDINNTAVDGDPRLAFQLSGTSVFTMGVDDGDSDKFKLGTTTIDTNTRLTIDGSGNVGIGSTAPATKLTVEDTTAASGIDINNTAVDGDPRLAFQLSGTSVFTMGVDDGDADKFKIGTTTVDTNTRLTIDSSGNIGIGNASPVRLFHLGGAMRIDSLASAPATPAQGDIYRNGANLYFYNGTSWINLSGGGSSLWQQSGSNIYYNAGTVGVGTATPNSSYKLHVDGGTGTGGYFTSSTGVALATDFGEIGLGTVTVRAGYKAQIHASGRDALYVDTDTDHAVEGVSTDTAAGGCADFYASGSCTVDYGVSSSIRWKKNIRPIDNVLEKISRIRGVYFDWDQEHGGQHDVGMIAEEVGEVFPEVVAKDPSAPGYAMGMDESSLAGVFVEAIKALKSEIDNLKSENTELRKLIEK